MQHGTPDCVSDPPHIDETREKKREIEVFRYLPPASPPITPDAQPNDTSNTEPQTYSPAQAGLGFDAVLTALAQLAAQRLNCDRAFVSLIDSKNQHIIAEASRSISLFDVNQHVVDDGLAFGAGAIDVDLTICLKTMPVFTHEDGRFNQETENILANPTQYTIRDFTQHELFKDRPYVTGWPFMRFYAEVPVKGKAGLVLGSVCVVHNEVRKDLSPDELVILQEISAAITQHLERLRRETEHARVSRLLTGLDTFMGGSQNSGPVQSVIPNSESKQSSEQSHEGSLGVPSTDGPPDQVPDTVEAVGGHAADHDFKRRRLSEGHTAGIDTTPASPTISPTGTFKRPDDNVGTQLGPTYSHEINEDAARDEYFSRAIQDKFSEAASLLRKCMEADGIAFVDGSQRSQGSSAGHQHIYHRTMANGRTESEGMTDGDTANTGSSTSPVPAVIGRSTNKESPSLDGRPSRDFSPPEHVVQELIGEYPRGCVFHLDENGELFDVHAPTSLPQDESVSTSAMNMNYNNWFPEARSVIFVPLWDPSSTTCFAACFGWSTNAQRVFTFAELRYLTAFGHSITAEASRLRLLATDKMKSDFMSSISHELRSPLHGMLSSAELLYGMTPTPEQQRMIAIIESCGKVLLETMNHLLDFAKINDLTRKNSLGGGIDSSAANIAADFNLAVMLEETMDVVLAGHNLAGDTANKAASSSIDLDPPQKTDIPTLALSIDKSDWMIHSQPGAWRRILINLINNSLKYTEQGYIKVTLQCKHIASTSIGHTDKPSCMAMLSVRDSGKGISQTYLKRQLFTPFEQEDPMSEGIGLGLSIVKRIVDSLGGDINVQSEAGVGTNVTVSIPITSSSESAGDTVMMTQELSGCQELTVCLLGFDSKTEQNERVHQAPPLLVLKCTLMRQFKDWANVRVAHAHTAKDVYGDIVVVPEQSLHLLDHEVVNGRIVLANPRWSLLIIKGYASQTGFSHSKTGGPIQALQEPIGPTKIAQALLQHLRGQDAGLISSTLSPLSSETPKPSVKVAPNADEATKDAPTKALAAKDPATVAATLDSTLRTLEKEKSELYMLLVDDNPINLKLLVMFMKKLKYDYFTASNGLEAVEAYERTKRPFNFILMDITMPVMDGFQATRNIRTYESKMKLQPSVIAALTGLGSAKSQQEATASGVDFFFTKPVAFKTIKSLLAGEDTDALPNLA